MKKFDLKSEEIQVSGRIFRLTEHTGPQMEAYVSQQIQVLKDAQQQAKSALDAGKSQSLEDTFADIMRRKAEFLKSILGAPVDDGGPLPDDFFANLSHRQIGGIIVAQDELDGLQEVLGKSADVLTLAAAEREAERIIAAQTSTLTPPPPDGPSTGPIFAAR